MINRTNNKNINLEKKKIAIDYVIGQGYESVSNKFCYVFDIHANSMFTSYIYMACQEGIR